MVMQSKRSYAMNLKKIALAAAAGSALLAAAPAFADPHWGRGHDRGWHGRPYYPHYYRAPAYYYVPPRPVIVAPPAYVYAPPIYAPAPGIYGQVPLGPDVRVNFGVRF
jgi:hypothetical protein